MFQIWWTLFKSYPHLDRWFLPAPSFLHSLHPSTSLGVRFKFSFNVGRNTYRKQTHLGWNLFFKSSFTTRLWILYENHWNRWLESRKRGRSEYGGRGEYGEYGGRGAYLAVLAAGSGRGFYKLPPPPPLTCKKGQNLAFSASLTPIWEKTLQYTFKSLPRGNKLSFIFPQTQELVRTMIFACFLRTDSSGRILNG